MKNSNYIINGILIVAIIVLFILQFTGKGTNTKHSEPMGISADSTGFHLPIAYIRTDSLFSNYKFYIDMNDVLMKKVEDKRLDISRRSDNFRKQVLDYQERAQRNTFLSPERQQQEVNNLERLQRELENYQAQADQELSLENMKMIQQLQDTIVFALREFNTPKKYEMILSNSGTDNILYADDKYDITKDIIDYLNVRYDRQKK